MGVPVLATDPQYVFPSTSPYASTWIAVTLEPFPLGGYTMQLAQHNPNVGWQDEQWASVGSPTTGTIYSYQDIQNAGGYLQLLQANMTAIQAMVASIYPNGSHPPDSWVSTYSGPQTIDLWAALVTLVSIYSAVQSAKQTQGTYTAIGALRDMLLKASRDDQITNATTNIWTAYAGQTRSQLITSLDTADQAVIANLPVN